jgi:hypothetical protein
MSDYLTNSLIALLCDIGEQALSKLAGDRKRDLERLLSEGYVTADAEPPWVCLHAHSQGRRVSWRARRRVE